MIRVAGAGLAGLAAALELARSGAQVRVYEAGPKIGSCSTARYAGGMLAPWCESETAGKDVIALGSGAAAWWAKITPVTCRGTLVLAPPRDRGELTRFASRTSGFRKLDAADIDSLEPDLAGRFATGLFFAGEAHLDPRAALQDIAAAAQAAGVEIVLCTRAPAQVDLDCTGAQAALPGLRAVRGEMAMLHCPDVAISRTIRLLHPRIPLYLVPRGGGVYTIGATMVETASTRPVTLRALSELLSGAFAIHPGFAEASVIETGTGLRPAFADNLPRLVQRGGTLHLNGLYRHGLLLAPAMAQQVARHFFPETNHANHRQCHPL